MGRGGWEKGREVEEEGSTDVEKVRGEEKKGRSKWRKGRWRGGTSRYRRRV